MVNVSFVLPSRPILTHATARSMHDADGPMVASKVYSELVKHRETFDYDAVPRAIDAAVRELKDAGVPPSRWATWIHMGI